MRVKFIWLVVIVLAVGSHCTAGTYFADSEGSWDDPATWGSSQSPGAGDYAYLLEHANVGISGGEESVARLRVAIPNMDDRGLATLNLTGSSVLQVEDELILGISAGSVGVINVNDTSELTANCDINLGKDTGTGYLNVYGGNVTTTGWLNVGGSAAADYIEGTGTVNIYGGVVTVDDYWIHSGSLINLAGGILRTENIFYAEEMMDYYAVNGKMVAYGGTSGLYYREVDGYAEIMAIPEPGTISLLGLGIFAVLRRKR